MFSRKKKNNTGFIGDVIKMWKKFGNENVTTLQEFGIGECIFVVMAHSDSFLVDTKSYLVWYEGQRPGTGTSRSQTSNIVLRELLAERAWCTISILTFPHQVGSSPRSYPFTSAKVRIPIYIATRSGRNLSDM